jgi:inositol-pentakisphosphate 2-kinase
MFEPPVVQLINPNGKTDVSSTDDAADEAATVLEPTVMEFFNEGAANVLFHVSVSEEACRGTILEGVPKLLLRLRKTVDQHPGAPGGPPPFISAEETLKYIYKTIGLDRSFILEHHLVRVSPDLVQELNERLVQLEERRGRDKRRIGERIGTDLTSGLLVKDMTSYADNVITFELKPKWLKPPGVDNARRCRTCAWHVKCRVSLQKRYCPLALLSKNEGAVRRQVKRHMPQISPSSIITSEEAEGAITRFFCDDELGFGILDTLRTQQEAYDSEGILSWIKFGDNDNPHSPEYLSYLSNVAKDEKTRTGNIERAMTLRDCTLYVRLTKLSDTLIAVDTKIGDLDPKVASPLKLAKWASDEYSLRTQGYYHGTEERNPETVPDGDEICIHWVDTPKA